MILDIKYIIILVVMIFVTLFHIEAIRKVCALKTLTLKYKIPNLIYFGNDFRK